MVVKEDDRRRGSRRCFAEHLTRMNDRRVERSDRHDLYSNDPMLGVEHDDAELLDGGGAVLWQKVTGQLPRRVVLGTLERRSHERAPAQLDGRHNLRRARGAHAADAHFVGRATCQRVQSTGVLEDAVGQFKRAAFARAAAKNDCYQFVVTERGNTEALELFARPIVVGELFHGAILKSSCFSGSPHAFLPRSSSSPVASHPTRRWIRPREQSMRRGQPARIGTPPASTPRPRQRSSARRTPYRRATTVRRSTKRSTAASTPRTPPAKPPKRGHSCVARSNATWRRLRGSSPKQIPVWRRPTEHGRHAGSSTRRAGSWPL